MLCIVLRVTKRSELGSISVQKTNMRHNVGLTSVGTEMTEVYAIGDKLFYVEKIYMNANRNRMMQQELMIDKDRGQGEQ
jgi:hypothetical protein